MESGEGTAVTPSQVQVDVQRVIRVRRSHESSLADDARGQPARGATQASSMPAGAGTTTYN